MSYVAAGVSDRRGNSNNAEDMYCRRCCCCCRHCRLSWTFVIVNYAASNFMSSKSFSEHCRTFWTRRSLPRVVSLVTKAQCEGGAMARRHDGVMTILHRHIIALSNRITLLHSALKNDGLCLPSYSTESQR